MARSASTCLSFSPVMASTTAAAGALRGRGAASPVDAAGTTKYTARPPLATASRRVVRALRGYRYPDTKDGRPVSDHPMKDGLYEHAMDALRYGVINHENARRTTQTGTLLRSYG